MSFRQFVSASVLAVALAGNVHDRAYYEEKFFGWLAQHKVEVSSGEVFVKMIQNFADNDDIISSSNAAKKSYTLAHNKFSHMSNAEFKEWVAQGGRFQKDLNSTPSSIHKAPALRAGLATEIDWTTKGAVTPVKDQGQCGSCWSFSTTGAVEGAYYNKYGSLESFSEQHLVDCDNLKHHFGRDHGCSGGLMDNAFDWIKKNDGICSETAYPYISGDTKKEGTCDETKCTKITKGIPQSYVDVEPNSDSAFMSALNVGPVSIAIEADESAFQLYSSGVLTAACGTNLDHGVLAVGYGTLDGTDFYKVKNSWGESWGLNGYILLERGVSQKEGQCGLLSAASYPVL